MKKPRTATVAVRGRWGSRSRKESLDEVPFSANTQIQARPYFSAWAFRHPPSGDDPVPGGVLLETVDLTEADFFGSVTARNQEILGHE